MNDEIDWKVKFKELKQLVNSDTSSSWTFVGLIGLSCMTRDWKIACLTIISLLLFIHQLFSLKQIRNSDELQGKERVSDGKAFFYDPFNVYIHSFY